jgi:hypothetical protein
MGKRISKAAITGVVTFVATFILQFAIYYARIRPTSGPVADVFLLSLVPAFLGIVGAVIAFVVSGT